MFPHSKGPIYSKKKKKNHLHRSQVEGGGPPIICTGEQPASYDKGVRAE